MTFEPSPPASIINIMHMIKESHAEPSATSIATRDVERFLSYLRVKRATPPIRDGQIGSLVGLPIVVDPDMPHDCIELRGGPDGPVRVYFGGMPTYIYTPPRDLA